MKRLLTLWLMAVGVLPLMAQQPQTQTAPIYSVNAKHTNGVAPGYSPSSGDNSTKAATDAFVLANASAGGLPTATAAGQAPVSSGAGKTYVAGQVAPMGGSYTFYVSGGTVYARNNNTMAIDYSNTDAGVVINAAINNVASTCGHLYFEPGVYDINSLIQEKTRGYTTVYYGIGIPGNAGTNLNCQWTIEGDGAPPTLDQFGAPVQTNGVIFYVTPTALATVSDTTQVMDLWARPGTDTVGANVWMQNFDLRFPNNQRGYETASDMTQAVIANYENVHADTNVVQSSLQFPVAGSVGLTTTASSHEENYMKDSGAQGYYVGLDIESEHTVLISSYGIDGDYCIDYGVLGSTLIYHSSSWINAAWGECAHGLTLGTNLQAGSLLDISGLDIEDATSGIWAPVTHATETNAGNTFGRISYSRVLQGIGISPLANLFDGGGGSAFQVQNSSGVRVGRSFAVTGSGSLIPLPNTQIDYQKSTNVGRMDIFGPNTTAVPGIYLAGHSSDESLNDSYLHCAYLTGCTFDDPLAAPGFSSAAIPLSCQSGLGDGLNAIPAGTYHTTRCRNETGQTWTITAIRCVADSGSSTCDVTNGAGTSLLTGAITGNSDYPAGTQSSTTTIPAGDNLKITFVTDGTTKQIGIDVAGTY